MDHTCQGIVIQTMRYNDQMCIARMFTEKHGMKAFLVRSGKSHKTARQQLLQPFSILEFESALKESATLHPAKNLQIGISLLQIPFDPAKTAMVLFLAEVIYKTIPDDYVNETLYVFLRDAIVLLDDAVDVRNFHIWCLLEIARHYGFYPQYEQADEARYFDLSTGYFVPHAPPHSLWLAGDSCQKLIDILEREWPEVQPIEMHSTMRKQLLESLVKFIQIHLDNFREIKSLAVLHEVFH